MKWIGISGTWRQTTPELEEDLISEVKDLLAKGYGVVSGGALGVDYLATQISLDAFPDGTRITVILPTTLTKYASHYRKRASENVITFEQAEELIAQLD